MSAGFAAIFNQPVGGSVEFAITGDPTTVLVDVPYSYTFGRVGGSPPVDWSASGLPGGLSIDEDTGEVSGIVGSLGMSIFGPDVVYMLVGVARSGIEFPVVGGDSFTTTISESGTLPPGVSATTATISGYKTRVFSGTVPNPDFGLDGPSGTVYVLAGVNRTWSRFVAYGGDQASMSVQVTSGTLPPGLAANELTESGSTVLKIEGTP